MAVQPAEARIENRASSRILICKECHCLTDKTIGECCNIRCWSLYWNFPYGSEEYETYRRIFSGEDEVQEEVEASAAILKEIQNQRDSAEPLYAEVRPGMNYIHLTTPEGVPLRDAQDLNYITEALKSGTEHQKIIAKEGLAAIALLLKKNKDYGSSAFDNPLLCPNLPAKTAILVRLSDKIKRFITLSSQEAEVKEETIEETMFDFLGYSLLYLTCPGETECTSD